MNSKSCACLPSIPAPREGHGAVQFPERRPWRIHLNSPNSLTVKHPHVISFTIKLKFYKACTEQRTHHSSPVLGAFPYSPRQLGNSHAVRIFVRIRAPSTNFASFGSSAYPQAERDPPPPVLAGLRWAHFQWLSTRGKFEHQREVERARTRSGERAEGKPSLSGHVQAASCRVEELRPATAADLSASFPYSSL